MTSGLVKGLLVAALAVGSVWAAVEPVEETRVLPGPWADLAPQERIKALRVAELDAARLLMERIYGIELDASTTVGDFILLDDTIQGRLAGSILGISTVGEPKYRPDGQVWVERKVTLREVYEVVTTTVKEQTRFGRLSTDLSKKIELTNQDTVIDVLGNAAIPGSDGHKKILAKRAAELNAYRMLAEKINGIHLTARATVRDFVLESDEMRARIATQIVKGAKPEKIVYLPDGSCEITMKITLAEVFKVVKLYSTKWPRLTKTERIEEQEIVRQTISVTALGAPRPEGGDADAMNAKSGVVAGTQVPETTVQVVSRTLVRSGVVLE